jgi:predicted phage terminase large subunit-like protein
MNFGRIIRTVRYWDLASSTKSSADYTAGIKMHATSEGYRIISDLVHGRWSPFERDNVVSRTAARDGLSCLIYCEREGGSSGPTVIAHYARLLRGYSFRGDRPGVDKVTRAQGFASYAENGLVIVCQAAWNQTFYDELEAFPNGDHDDIVDACSGAFNKLAELDNAFGIGQIISSADLQDESGRDLGNLSRAELQGMSDDAPLRTILENLE